MKVRSSIYYLAVLLFFGLSGYFLVLFKSPISLNPLENPNLEPFSILESLLKETRKPIPLLLFQIIVVAFFARLLGIFFSRKFKQPSVIGEIVAGILLGPSLLGYFFPEAQEWLFPASSLSILSALSQIGLILFMFIIGMELDIKILKNKAHSAVVISHASIIFPFFLGMILAFYLYEDYAPANVSFLPFTLFMGIAMSVTAFPVLARILQERNLTRTPLGALVITCAAADDITAWILLAVIVTISKAGTPASALSTIGLSFLYILGMIFIVSPFLKRLALVYSSRENLTRTAVALVLLILLSSAYATEIIGIHALFGAFLAGVVMPSDGNLKRMIGEKIEDLSVILLLPIFFAITGLKTKINLLNDPALWILLGIVVFLAVLGKFLGSAIAARFSGSNWEDSLSIGALMNTRGLMELVVLNIGYDLGILSPTLFAIFVLMALITTLSTGPALNGIQNYFSKAKMLAIAKPEPEVLSVVVAFAQEKMGKNLVRLAYSLSGNQKKYITVTALHISPSDSLTNEDVRTYRESSFEAIRNTGKDIGIPVKTEYRITDNITYEIVNFVKLNHTKLLMIGAAKSLFSKSYTGGKLKSILNYSPIPVAVFIDQNFQSLEKLAIVYKDDNDPILGFSEKLTTLRGIKTTKLKLDSLKEPNTDINPYFLAASGFKAYSLVVLDLVLWEEMGLERLEEAPASILLIRFP